MTIEFDGLLWYWRGPAPFFFVTVPAQPSAEIKAIQSSVTYGWGMIPVQARINDTELATAMFEKDGHFILPVKAVIRKAEKLEEGDVATVRLEVISSHS